MSQENHAAGEFRGNVHRKLDALKPWHAQLREPALEPELPIVDPHHHFYDEEIGRYFFDDLREDIATGGHNIIATVYLEASTMYRAKGPVEERPIGEVEFVNGMAAMSASGHYGNTQICAGIIGHADLRRGDAVKPVLEKLIAAGNGRFRGIRHCTNWDTGTAASFLPPSRQVPRHVMRSPAFRAGFACLHPLGLSFDSWLFYPQLPELLELVRAHPETNVIINHVGGVLGIPPHDRGETFPVWRENLRAFQEFPNVTVKIGGFGMLYWDWDFHEREMPAGSAELAETWRPYAETVIGLFGPQRCMMESNFPVDKQTAGYGVIWNALKRITQNHSPAEKAALYRDTAARVYRLELT